MKNYNWSCVYITCVCIYVTNSTVKIFAKKAATIRTHLKTAMYVPTYWRRLQVKRQNIAAECLLVAGKHKVESNCLVFGPLS